MRGSSVLREWRAQPLFQISNDRDASIEYGLGELFGGKGELAFLNWNRSRELSRIH